MNEKILNTGVQDFIKNNWNTDILSLLLKKPIFSDIPQKELIEQLEAKKRCRQKLPTWFNTPNIYYPNKLHIEQTSSEITAAYKARLVGGNSLLDLTGGLGIDSYYFAKKVKKVIHCEVNENLSKIAAHNFKVLGVDNCIFEAGDGIGLLRNKPHQFDWIYADPSRRHNVKGKVFRLEDCEPNIPQNLELIFEYTDCILLKAAPLLDLTLAAKELQNVSEIHVVAIQNEVKEVLFMLKKVSEEPIAIQTVNFQKDGEINFSFLWDEEKTTQVEYGNPENYLYEPNAAILKAGGFNSVGKRFGLKKVAPHSHIYTGIELIDFPGRTFKIQEVLPYNKNTMKSLVRSKANITIRNFPENVLEIRKKYHIKDGGDIYLFLTKNYHGNLMIINCRKTNYGFPSSRE